MTATHATTTGTIRPLQGLTNPNRAFCGASTGARAQGLYFTANADEITCKRCINKRATALTPEQLAEKKAAREAKEAAEAEAFMAKLRANTAKAAAKA